MLYKSLREELNISMIRPICKACNKNFAAPNYWKNGVRHYRSRCSICVKINRKEQLPDPRWRTKGYKKKSTCDLCGFKSAYSSQIVVYHIDGNLNNCDFINLRSVCLCCIEVIKRKNLTWKIGDLEVD